jgi:hypothetical protein
MSMVVGPLQAALEEAIKAQQGLQLEVAQLTLKMEDLKEEHSEYIKDVNLIIYPQPHHNIFILGYRESPTRGLWAMGTELKLSRYIHCTES